MSIEENPGVSAARGPGKAGRSFWEGAAVRTLSSPAPFGAIVVGLKFG